MLSGIYTHLNTSERKELEDMLSKPGSPASGETKLRYLLNLVRGCHDLETKIYTPVCCYSGEALGMLRLFYAKYFYNIPGFGFVLLKDSGLCKLKEVPNEIFTKFIKDPRLEQIVREFVVEWVEDLDKRYIDFMDVRGWKEEFEKDMNEKWFYLKGRIEYLRKEGLLREFIHRFGKDRIARWKPEHLALLGL